MPASPNRRREAEVLSRRGLIKRSPIQASDDALVKGSGVFDRDLTLEEAAALVLAGGQAATSPNIYKPETLKRNAVLLRNYQRVTKRVDVDLAGVELYVRTVFHIQAHRRGLGKKTTTAESMIDNTCRVLARLWRVQNKSLTVPSDINFALQGFQKEALRTLTRSTRTTEFCDDLASLFMRAFARK